MNKSDVIFIAISHEGSTGVLRTDSNGNEIYSGSFNGSFRDESTLPRTVERIYSHSVKPYTNRAYIVVHSYRVLEDMCRECKVQKKSFPLNNIRWVSFSDMTWPLFATDRCDSLDLSEVGKYLGFEAPIAHSGTIDVGFLAKCFFAYLERVDMSFATQAVATKVVDGIKGFFS
jgi:hypothetical protein